MKKVIKNKGKTVQAWQLGAGSETEKRLLSEGTLVKDGEGYRLRTQEAADTGEYAAVGDYFKLDGKGFPYPNSRAFFEENHTHLDGDSYEQHPKPLLAWFPEQEPENELIAFLKREKGLELHPDDPAAYLSAPLWGTTETAAKDAAVVFYSITKAPDGTILDADFNFVSKEIFAQTYTVLT